MVFAATEMLVIGTTLNVASTASYEGRRVGVECPGPIGKSLDALLEQDIFENRAMRTEY
jgi:hypothetical protein